MKKTKIMFIVIAFCIFMVWFYPYVKNELLTWKHGIEFNELQKSTQILGDVDYLKVLDYSDNSARVYYVGKSGNILTFVKNDGVWDMKSWTTVWSKSGSADNFIWPYFYHSAEGLVLIIVIGFFALITTAILFLVKIKTRKIKHRTK